MKRGKDKCHKGKQACEQHELSCADYNDCVYIELIGRQAIIVKCTIYEREKMMSPIFFSRSYLHSTIVTRQP
jgi:hypothetical protein